MANATSVEISDIKASGGHYTTLAAWWTATKSGNGRGGGGGGLIAPQADVYSGFDAGAVSLTGAGFTPVANYHVEINAAAGHEQDGTDTLTQGARVGFANPGGIIIGTGLPFTQIKHLRIVSNPAGKNDAHITITNSTDCRVEGNLLQHDTNPTDKWRGIYWEQLAGTTGTVNGVIYNNLILGENVSRAIGIYVFVSPATASDVVVNVQIYNNTLSEVLGDFGMAAVYINGLNSGVGALTINPQIYNTIVTGSGFVNFKILAGANTTINMDVQNCSSEDATADDWGGAGNLINQAGASIFVNPLSDVRLKRGSPCSNVGKDVRSTIPTDALGTTWQRPMDMGALEDGARLIRHPGMSGMTNRPMMAGGINA